MAPRWGLAGDSLIRVLGRAAAVLLIVVASASVLGAATALPRPLQDAVATIAEYIGIDVPRGAAGDAPSEPSPLLHEELPTSDRSPATPVAEGEDGDTRAGSKDCQDDGNPGHGTDDGEDLDDECADAEDDGDEGDDGDE